MKYFKTLAVVLSLGTALADLAPSINEKPGYSIYLLPRTPPTDHAVDHQLVRRGGGRKGGRYGEDNDYEYAPPRPREKAYNRDHEGYEERLDKLYAANKGDLSKNRDFDPRRYGDSTPPKKKSGLKYSEDKDNIYADKYFGNDDARQADHHRYNTKVNPQYKDKYFELNDKDTKDRQRKEQHRGTSGRGARGYDRDESPDALMAYGGGREGTEALVGRKESSREARMNSDVRNVAERERKKGAQGKTVKYRSHDNREGDAEDIRAVVIKGPPRTYDTREYNVPLDVVRYSSGDARRRRGDHDDKYDEYARRKGRSRKLKQRDTLPDRTEKRGIIQSIQSGMETSATGVPTAELKADYQEGLELLDNLLVNATGTIMPIISNMINGSREALVWDMALSLYTMVTPGYSYIGPYSAGGTAFKSIEAAEAQMYPNMTNSTRQALYDLDTYLMNLYEDTYNAMEQALNVTGAWAELEYLLHFMDTNDTSLLPPTFTELNLEMDANIGWFYAGLEWANGTYYSNTTLPVANSTQAKVKRDKIAEITPRKLPWNPKTHDLWIEYD